MWAARLVGMSLPSAGLHYNGPCHMVASKCLDSRLWLAWDLFMFFCIETNIYLSID